MERRMERKTEWHGKEEERGKNKEVKGRKDGWSRRENKYIYVE